MRKIFIFFGLFVLSFLIFNESILAAKNSYSSNNYVECAKGENKTCSVICAYENQIDNNKTGLSYIYYDLKTSEYNVGWIDSWETGENLENSMHTTSLNNSEAIKIEDDVLKDLTENGTCPGQSFIDVAVISKVDEVCFAKKGDDYCLTKKNDGGAIDSGTKFKGTSILITEETLKDIERNDEFTIDDVYSGNYGKTEETLKQDAIDRGYTVTPKEVDDFTHNCADFAKGIRIGGYLLVLIKVLVPLILIVKCILDIFKIVISSKPEDVMAYKTKAIASILSAIIIFLLPSMIEFIINMLPNGVKDSTASSDIEVCKACIFHPSSDECSQHIDIE